MTTPSNATLVAALDASFKALTVAREELDRLAEGFAEAVAKAHDGSQEDLRAVSDAEETLLEAGELLARAEDELDGARRLVARI